MDGMFAKMPYNLINYEKELLFKQVHKESCKKKA